MAIEPELLEILRCPETHQTLAYADDALIKSINDRIRAGALKNHGGELVKSPVSEGLVRADGKCLFVIENDIPNMLTEERIDL